MTDEVWVDDPRLEGPHLRGRLEAVRSNIQAVIRDAILGYIEDSYAGASGDQVYINLPPPLDGNRYIGRLVDVLFMGIGDEHDPNPFPPDYVAEAVKMRAILHKALTVLDARLARSPPAA